MVFRNKPILAAAVLLGQTLGNHTPEHVSGMNGEEYCEGPDRISNRTACQASECCHWNTWEAGEASFNGQGRCWSSIGQHICEDGQPAINIEVLIKELYEDTPMEELFGAIWKDLEILAEDMESFLQDQLETDLDEITGMVKLVHGDLNLDLEQLALILEDIRGGLVLDLTILKEELEDDFENIIEDIEEGLGSMNFTNSTEADFGEIALDLQDDLQDIIEDITEALNLQSLFGDLANAFNTTAFNVTGFNMTGLGLNMTGGIGCPQPWIGDGTCDPVCNTSANAFDGGDCDEPNLCPQHWIGDGICDPVCNNTANAWDGGDCADFGPYHNTTGNDTIGIPCTQQWIGDGICDVGCNTADNAFDGGDCDDDGFNITTFCPEHWIGDSVCDPSCNNTEKEWDGGDCENGGSCPQHWIGDGVCDPVCNNTANDWDGGDCADFGLDQNTTNTTGQCFEQSFIDNCVNTFVGAGGCAVMDPSNADPGELLAIMSAVPVECFNCDNIGDVAAEACSNNGNRPIPATPDLDFNITEPALNTTGLDQNATGEDILEDLLKDLKDILGDDMEPVTRDECAPLTTKDSCDGDSNCVWSNHACQTKGTLPVCVLMCAVKCTIEHGPTKASCDCVDACDKSACDQAGVGMVDEAVQGCREMAARNEEPTTTTPGVEPEPTDNQKQGKCKSYDNRKECRAAGCRFKRRKNKCVMKKKNKKKNKKNKVKVEDL